MKPYLIHLQRHFTSYELLYTLAMRSQYSIRLYEILKSYAYKKNKIFDIEDLKRTLSAENYTRFPDFKRYVLDIAVREMNEFSDLAIAYELIKESRRYAKINFSIQIKKNMQDRMQTWARIDEIINPEQISLLEKTCGEKI